MTLTTAQAAGDLSYEGIKGKYLIVRIADDLYEILLERRRGVRAVGLAHSEREVMDAIRWYDLD